MSVWKDISELLQTSGGWGLSAILAGVCWYLMKKNDALQEVLRLQLVEVTSKLVAVATEQNLVTKQQIELLTTHLKRGDH